MTVATAAPARGPAAPQRRPARPRRWIGLAVLLALTVVACLASIAIGTRSIGLGEVWRALLDSDLTSEEAVIVRQLRVPRTVLGLMVGMALGVAGALMQGHTRNPLGDPGLLGVTAGASLAVVLSIAWLGIGTPSGYVWFAFLGALAGTVAVYLIGSAGRGGATPVTLALAGAALSALLYGLVRAVLVSRPADAGHLPLLGGRLAGRPGRRRRLAGAARSSPSACCSRWSTRPALNLLGLGEDVARGLGQRIWLARVVGLAAITLLGGAATAACGPIAFVGLVVPHAVRAVTGPDHRWLIPCSGAGRARSCCSPPTSSAGSSCGPASCRSASCSR